MCANVGCGCNKQLQGLGEVDGGAIFENYYLTKMSAEDKISAGTALFSGNMEPLKMHLKAAFADVCTAGAMDNMTQWYEANKTVIWVLLGSAALLLGIYLFSGH
ncbi:MAG: hypothetical protein NT007_09535 [Candidatus Kapabacteria bacterium]|nr:hypothetical protein [Candidatus Kapabacteria bacterium]